MVGGTSPPSHAGQSYDDEDEPNDDDDDDDDIDELDDDVDDESEVVVDCDVLVVVVAEDTALMELLVPSEVNDVELVDVDVVDDDDMDTLEQECDVVVQLVELVDSHEVLESDCVEHEVDSLLFVLALSDEVESDEHELSLVVVEQDDD